MGLFAATLFILSQISVPETLAWAYMLVPFANGLCTGAALNYTLVHALHITQPSTHFVVSSLISTFRGFGASFGATLGSGIWERALTSTFNSILDQRNLPRDPVLLEKLIGSPAVVASLTGLRKEIAILSYEAAFKALFLSGGIMALVFLTIQAGTGWKAPEKTEAAEEDI